MAHDDQHRDPLEARVITVSREALRADLLDLELRLTKVIVDGLGRKADLSYVQSLDARLAQIEREAVRREGPDMVRVRETIAKLAEVELTIRERAKWGEQIAELRRDVDEVNEEMKSEAELRQLVRSERTGWQGSQWKTFQWVSGVILLLATVISLYLAFRAQDAPGPGESGGAKIVHLA